MSGNRLGGGWRPLLGVSAFGRLVEGVQDHEQITLYTFPFVLLFMSPPASIQAKSRYNDHKRFKDCLEENWGGTVSILGPNHLV